MPRKFELIITLFLVAALFIFIFLISPRPPAHAIVIALPAVLGVSLAQLFIGLFLVLFVPVAFFGGILRLIGYKHDIKGKWRLDSGQLFLNFAKYLAYHVLFFGIWFMIIRSVTGESYFVTAVSYSLAPMPTLIDDRVWLAFVYVLIWAFLAPYAIYWWNRKRGNVVFRPGWGTHLRLFLWNVLIFYAASYVVLVFAKF